MLMSLQCMKYSPNSPKVETKCNFKMRTCISHNALPCAAALFTQLFTDHMTIKCIEISQNIRVLRFSMWFNGLRTPQNSVSVINCNYVIIMYIKRPIIVFDHKLIQIIQIRVTLCVDWVRSTLPSGQLVPLQVIPPLPLTLWTLVIINNNTIQSRWEAELTYQAEE